MSPGGTPSEPSATRTTRCSPRRSSAGRCPLFKRLLPAASGDHLRDQPALPTTGDGRLPARRCQAHAHVHHRGGGRAARPHGLPRGGRLPLDQRRGEAPLGADSNGASARLLRALSRAFQQQDQWRHAAAVAPGVQPRALGAHHRAHRPWVGNRPGAPARAGASHRGPGVPRARARSQAGEQGGARQSHQHDARRRGRSVVDVRRADQAVARVQAPDTQRASHHRPVPAHQARRGRDAANLHLRSQGRAGLPPGQAHHPAHPRHWGRGQRGPRLHDQGRVHAELPRLARREDHPRGGRLRADLHGRHGGLRDREHEAVDERRADRRNARRREHRDPRGGRRRELLPFRPHGEGGRRAQAHGLPGRVAYEADEELRQAIDLLASGFFSPEERDLFRPLVDASPRAATSTS